MKTERRGAGAVEMDRENGNLRDWWSERVNAEFERRPECVKKQYDGFTVLGDLTVNGKLTLGENIADLGGLKLAYRALKAKGGWTSREDRDFFGNEEASGSIVSSCGCDPSRGPGHQGRTREVARYH